MKRQFFIDLYKEMEENEKIVALTGDLGFGGFDRIVDEFPERYINCGAAEQAMLDVAVGVAMSGKVPIVYSITPFLLARGFETIRNYISHENVPVILVGAGRGRDYKNLGFSHWADDDKDILALFKNIRTYWPKEKEEVGPILKKIINEGCPSYLNLRR